MRDREIQVVRPSRQARHTRSMGLAILASSMLLTAASWPDTGRQYGQVHGQANGKVVSQSVSDPDFQFDTMLTVGFIPIYFHDWYKRSAPLVSPQQAEALFPNEVMNFRKEPIFWAPGDNSREFSELQEKQMYGYFKSALAIRGYEVSYLPLERPALHGSRTVEALHRSGIANENLSLENLELDESSIADSVGGPDDTRWHSFTIPLTPDRIDSQKVVVRYRAGRVPDLILQAWFFQQGADYVRAQPDGASGLNLVTRPRPRPDVYAQGVWLQVWAQPPHYKLNVWSGAILRASTKPDINIQAKGMIAQLLAREDFPRGLLAQPVAKR